MQNHLRKTATVLAIASLALVGPTVVPVVQLGATAGANCLVGTQMTFGSALAVSPCAPVVGSTYRPTPAPAIAVIVGAFAVIVNAAYVWNTQCRELTSQEAVTSTFLPLLGMAFNKQDNKCHH